MIYKVKQCREIFYVNIIIFILVKGYLFPKTNHKLLPIRYEKSTLVLCKTIEKAMLSNIFQISHGFNQTSLEN